MTETFLDVGVDWKGSGYWANDFAIGELTKRPKKEHQSWLEWQAVLGNAKQGRFANVIDLIRVYEVHSNWLLSGACSDLLGDAGDTACLRQMASRLTVTQDAVVALMLKVDFGDALCRSGKLEFVPAIVNAYCKVATFDDAAVIPDALWQMLGRSEFSEPSAFGGLDAYARAVIDRGRELEAKFGPSAAVFEGELYDVREIARRLARQLQEATGGVDLGFLQPFAATTGIDTTSFHEGPLLKPLTALAVVEEFLSSAQAKQFEPGARYFWGHKIE